MPKASSWVLIGGYIFASQPLTLNPRFFGNGGNPAHKRAADTDNVDVFHNLESLNEVKSKNTV